MRKVLRHEELAAGAGFLKAEAARLECEGAKPPNILAAGTRFLQN